jgi:serine/threonine protein kinase
MSPPNPDDPLRTTDHAPAAVPEIGKASLPLGDKATVTFQPKPGESHDGPPATPAAPPIPGYEIEAVLGRGGMGGVYKARHLALKRTVALKMVLAGGHAAPQELARFRIEAEAAARLQHPNIVQIHEVGEAGGQPNLWRYREGYEAARATKDDFAAAFYLNLLPPDERKALSRD